MTRRLLRRSSAALLLFFRWLAATTLPTCRCLALEKTVVLLYHKPPDVITSHSGADQAPKGSGGRGRMTVYDDVRTARGHVAPNGDRRRGRRRSFEEITGLRRGAKLHAVGRLDAATAGLLLLTNDGALVHQVTNPSAAATAADPASDNNEAPYEKLVTKTYEAVIMGHHEQDSLGLKKILTEGVDLGLKYGRTRPAVDLKVLSHPTATSTVVEITIAEGKNRQVRRMFHAIGSGVMKLTRTRIGDKLHLAGLEQGQWRVLGADEVASSLGWRVRTLGPTAWRRPRSRGRKGAGRGRDNRGRESKDRRPPLGLSSR